MNINPNYFTSADNKQIAYYHIESDRDKHNSILLLHCGGGYIDEKYISLANKLNDLNMTCYLMDLRGHGLSEGDRGDVPEKILLYDDLKTMLKIIKNNSPQSKIFLDRKSVV